MKTFLMRKKLFLLSAFFFSLVLMAGTITAYAAGDTMEQDLELLEKNYGTSWGGWGGGEGIYWRNLGKDNSSMVVCGKRSHRLSFSQKDLKNAVSASKPNTICRIKAIDKEGMKSLVINADLIGIAVEPSASDQFILDYVGVADTSLFSVKESRTGSTLTITAKSSGKEKLYYINTNQDKRVNTLRIQIPKNTDITIHNQSGNVLIEDASAQIRGGTEEGLVKVSGSRLTEAIALECGLGDIIISGKEISGNIDLSATSGDAAVYGDSVSGDCSLRCKSGDIYLTAGVVTGPVNMVCASGDIHYNVNQVKGATSLACASGDIHANVTTLYQDFLLKIESGDGKMNFRKQPQNLTYIETRESARRLPSGWKDGYRAGTGKPVLKMSCSSGDMKISID